MVVIVLPELALFAHLTQAVKEVSVEQLAAKRAVKCPRISNRINKKVITELNEESRSRQWAARMTSARFLGKLGMTFFLVDYGYLCATT